MWAQSVLFRFRPLIAVKQRSSLSHLFAATVMILFGLFSPLPPAQAAAATPAEIFVQQNVDRGYMILNGKDLSDTDRRVQFRSFILGLTDSRRIGMFTLGPYANRASKPDLDAFTAAFSDYAVAIYETRLNKYKGQTLKVTGSNERVPDDVVVNCDVINPNAAGGPVIKVGFRVRKAADGRPIVTDINVEGVWLALSQRSDFTGFLQQNNGSISALTENLKNQTQQLRASALQSNVTGNNKT